MRIISCKLIIKQIFDFYSYIPELIHFSRLRAKVTLKKNSLRQVPHTLPFLSGYFVPVHQ